MTMTFIAYNEPQALPCPPETVRKLAAEGKDQTQIAAALSMGLSTFRTKLRNSKSVANAWKEGHEEYRRQQVRPNNRIGKVSYEDREFDYTVKFKSGDLSVFLAVACGYRRRAQIVRACGLSSDFVVPALDRLEVNLLITKDVSGFFDEYTVFLTRKGKDVQLPSGMFLFLFLSFLQKRM